MFKKIVTAVIGLIALSANAQNSFSIKGKISPEHNGQKVMLDYSNSGHSVKDSAIVRNGSFFLTGRVSDVIKGTISLKKLKDDKMPVYEETMSIDQQEFFLENKCFSIQGPSINTAVIRGGRAQADYLLLQSQLKPLKLKMKPLRDQQMRLYFKEKNEQAAKALIPQLDSLQRGVSKEEDAFILKHPDSYVSLDLLDERSETIYPAEFEPYFNTLSPRLKGTTTGKHLYARLMVAKKTDIGQHSIEFSQNDTTGVPVSLSSLKGKYVLIDFWASWCSPCRAENPNLVKVYQKFKDKKFEIIGVSLDIKKEAWLKAIVADTLTWIQVSDLKGWKNAVASQYDVQSVPQNFLVGPDGKILGKNLDSDELEKELSKLIPEH